MPQHEEVPPVRTQVEHQQLVYLTRKRPPRAASSKMPPSDLSMRVCDLNWDLKHLDQPVCQPSSHPLPEAKSTPSPPSYIPGVVLFPKPSTQLAQRAVHTVASRSCPGSDLVKLAPEVREMLLRMKWSMEDPPWRQGDEGMPSNKPNLLSRRAVFFTTQPLHPRPDRVPNQTIGFGLGPESRTPHPNDSDSTPARFGSRVAFGPWITVILGGDTFFGEMCFEEKDTSIQNGSFDRK